MSYHSFVKLFLERVSVAFRSILRTVFPHSFSRLIRPIHVLYSLFRFFYFGRADNFHKPDEVRLNMQEPMQAADEDDKSTFSSLPKSEKDTEIQKKPLDDNAGLSVLLKPTDCCRADESDDLEEDIHESQHANPATDDNLSELLKPCQFSWADEFDDYEKEIEDSSHLSLHDPSEQSDDTIFSDLLKPSQFCWADESDELEQNGTARSRDQTEGETFFANQANNPISQDREQAGMPVQEIDELLTSTHLSWTDECNELDSESLSAPENSARNKETNLEHPSYESMQDAVRTVFCWREWLAKYSDRAGDIHHFNWFGMPIYERSSTPPEISLWFMLKKPKAAHPDNLRVASALNRARAYIDPVCFYVDYGLHELPDKSLDIVRYAKGRTYRFYTPHGSWKNDAR